MKNRLRCLLVLLFVFSVTAVTHAQNAVITTKIKTIYLGSDGAVFYNRVVQQTDLFLNWNNGIYLDIWTSTGFNKKKDFDKEVDFTLGKTGRFGKFGYSANVNYFTIVVIDVANVNVELNRVFQLSGDVSVSPFVRGEYYFPVHHSGPRRGAMAVVGAKSNVRIFSWLDLFMRAQIRKDSGAFGFQSATLAQGYAALNIKLSKRVTGITGVNLSTPILPTVRLEDGRSGRVVWEAGLSYRF